MGAKVPKCDKGHPFKLFMAPVKNPAMSSCSGEYVNCADCSKMIKIKLGYWMCDSGGPCQFDTRVCKDCYPKRKAYAQAIEDDKARSKA